MTVPSCEEHNTAKSNSDEYLRFVLASTSGSAHPEVIDRTVRGVVRLMQKGSHSLDKYGVTKLNVPTNAYVTDGSALVDCLSVTETIAAIARAIYHYDSGKSKKLTSAVTTFPIFLGLDPDISVDFRQKLSEIETFTRQDLNEYPILGTNQDVFGYQVIEGEDLIVVNMIFYREKLACVISAK